MLIGLLKMMMLGHLLLMKMVTSPSRVGRLRRPIHIDSDVDISDLIDLNLIVEIVSS